MTTLPYPGYEEHRPGMTEEENEARVARNEVAWWVVQVHKAESHVEDLHEELHDAKAKAERYRRELASLRAFHGMEEEADAWTNGSDI